MLAQPHTYGWVLDNTTAAQISHNMSKTPPYDLTMLGHDCIMRLIDTLRSHQIKIRELYVDTVGNETFLQR